MTAKDMRVYRGYVQSIKKIYDWAKENDIKVPNIPTYMMYITFIAMFFVLFVWSPYFGIITALLIITDLVLMLVSKRFKCLLCLDIGINNYKKSTKYVSKALIYNKDCEAARLLLNIIKGDSLKNI